MAEAAKVAAGRPLPKLRLPIDAVKMKCVNCGSAEFTRAVYQHEHEGVVVTYELPAYTNGAGKVPYNWPCQCGENNVGAIYVQCGGCGCIARVDNVNHRVHPPKPPIEKEA